MTHNFTLEYWVDNGWYVGKLKEVPGAPSQGATLAELEVNIAEAYTLMLEDEAKHSESKFKEILLQVA